MYYRLLGKNTLRTFHTKIWIVFLGFTQPLKHHHRLRLTPRYSIGHNSAPVKSKLVRSSYNNSLSLHITTSFKVANQFKDRKQICSLPR